MNEMINPSIGKGGTYLAERKPSIETATINAMMLGETI
jgi:hypothetical protein